MKTVIQNESIDKSKQFNHHKQKISISPHASQALVHRHSFLRNLLRRAFAAVVLAGHRVCLDLQEREETAMESTMVKKCEGKGTVASADVFEARTLGWYLKPWSEEVDASGHAKGNRN